MKAKKAIRKLARVEDLLAGVIDQYSGSKGMVRACLDSAVESVGRAKKTVSVKAPPKVQKKSPVKARASEGRASSKRGKATANGAKRQAAVA